jgi:beta-phosphoglucomutase
LTNIKACIFDLDGVIVDTAHFHFIAWKRLAAEWGIELTADYNERLKGVGRMDSLDIILSIGNHTLSDQEKKEAAVKKNEWYLAQVESLTSDDALPNVVAFLSDLKRAGYLIAIGSSSKNARPILERLCLTDMFNAIVDGNDLTNAKPDPEVFTKAADLLGAAPENCVVFEDAQSGIQAANRAKMKCIGVGNIRNLHEADFVIPTFEDFSADTLTNMLLTTSTQN